MYSSNEALIESMQQQGTLKNPALAEAFLKADRKLFMPEKMQALAYTDQALAIGHDQTISQPSTVAFMLELLDVKKGQSVLDIGSGSGWASALLGFLAGEKGQVKALERIDSLLQKGKKNIAKVDLNNITMQKAGTSLGLPGESFDKILVSAAAKEIPQELIQQLKNEGTMVLPVQNSICKVTKDQNSKLHTECFYGFAFVPLL